MDKAIFLDRDGVINVEKKHFLESANKIVEGFIHKKEDFEFLEGAIEGLKLLSKSDYKIIIITNQSGIARGYFSEEDVNKLNQYMLDIFKENDIRIDDIFYCTHYPPITGECDCRKPKIGMIKKAKEKYDLDLKNSYFIGDSDRDIENGKNAGGVTILIDNGIREHKIKADYTVKNLYLAAKLILNS